MDQKQRGALTLIALGCAVILLGSAMHLFAAYPMVSAALAPSNLENGLKNALRSVFALIALTWMTIAIVALIAAFSKTRPSRTIVLVCGASLLLQTPVWVYLMGWFVGNEMFLAGALLMVGGGLFFRERRLA